MYLEAKMFAPKPSTIPGDRRSKRQRLDRLRELSALSYRVAILHNKGYKEAAVRLFNTTVTKFRLSVGEVVMLRTAITNAIKTAGFAGPVRPLKDPRH